MQVHIDARPLGTTITDKSTGHLVDWASWHVRQLRGDRLVAVIEINDGPTREAHATLSYSGDAAAVVPEA